ncbi:AraC family transcriptional regulator [Saccharibacillus sacchari]|uniref:AraC family transcriptional regulator n=1 Tax=Saccharibacillus sacchari TaxID=456493 RepID=A0ACC6PDW5_9BACL
MLAFKLFHQKGKIELPLSLYSCGLHDQHEIHRPIGYPTFQCMICFDGVGTFRFENGVSVMMQKGDILFIPGKQAHHYAPAAERWTLGYTGIEGSLVEPLIHTLKLPVMRTFSIGEENLDQVEAALTRLWNGNELHERDADHHASSEMYGLLTSIAAMIQTESKPSGDRYLTGVNELMRKAVYYMEQHYMEDLSIANIADTVGYSKQHFQRKFKETHSVNPSEYLQRLRLLKGAQLLAEQSELSVGEIATRVGMEFNYFVRLFKREHGITPAQYRLTRAYE